MVSKFKVLTISALFIALLAVLPWRVQAEHPIHIKDGYARATFPMATSAALYFTMHNSLEETVVLKRVEIDSEIAAEAQIHITEMQGDMMRMREVKEGITMGPDDRVSFAPGGYHVMLLGLKQGLAEGQSVSISLYFDNADMQAVTLPVKKVGERDKEHHHH